MLANCELSLALLFKLNSALDNGDFKVKMGQASRAKASITKLARETVALARESMGGNGILLENGVIRHMMDTEVYYTYEGSYDINSLISGKEITGGLSAFV
jgi:glutaryl-CoA dehydrogenase